MKFTVTAAALLLALPAAGAQSPLPSLRVEPTTGGSIFYVKNVYTQPLTAYIIELVDYPGSSFALVQDDILATPIAPDQEKRIPVGNMTVGAVPDYVKVQAAIYADGSTAGAPDKVERLVARRTSSLDIVHDLTRRMEVAQEQQATSTVVAANLKRAMEFMMSPPDADKMSQRSINQAAARELFNSVTEYLDRHTIGEALTRLHEWEKTLNSSKPPLQ